MDNSKYILDTILKNLCNEKDFDGMMTEEFFDFCVAVADIGIPDNDGNLEVYRIMVTKQEKENCCAFGCGETGQAVCVNVKNSKRA